MRRWKQPWLARPFAAWSRLLHEVRGLLGREDELRDELHDGVSCQTCFLRDSGGGSGARALVQRSQCASARLT